MTLAIFGVVFPGTCEPLLTSRFSAFLTLNTANVRSASSTAEPNLRAHAYGCVPVRVCVCVCVQAPIAIIRVSNKPMTVHHMCNYLGAILKLTGCLGLCVTWSPVCDCLGLFGRPVSLPVSSFITLTHSFHFPLRGASCAKAHLMP